MLDGRAMTELWPPPGAGSTVVSRRVSCQLSPHQCPHAHFFIYSTDTAHQPLGTDGDSDGHHSCFQGACSQGGKGVGDSEVNMEGNIPANDRKCGWRPALDRTVREGPEKWEGLAIGRAIQAAGTTCAKELRQQRRDMHKGPKEAGMAGAE